MDGVISDQGMNTSGKDRDIRQKIRESLTLSINKYADYFKTLRKFHRYYMSANELRRRKEPDRDEGAVNWKANLFIPYSFATIETAVPRLVFSLFGARPYLQTVGRTQDDQKGAESIDAVMDFDFDQAKVPLKSVTAFKSLYKYGLTIGKVTYRKEYYTRKRRVTVPKYEFDPNTSEIIGSKMVTKTIKEDILRFDGPEYLPIDVFKFFPDPLFYEINEMRYVCEYEKTSRFKLERQNKQYKELTGDYLYKNLDQVPNVRGAYLLEDIPANASDETAEIFGYAYNTQRRSAESEFFEKDTLELIHYWEDDRHSILANGQTIIMDGENEFEDKLKPYFKADCFPIEFEFYPLGLLHPTSDLQEEMNSWRNVTMDQGKLNLYNIWAMDPQTGLSEADMALYPGKAVEVEFSANGRPLVQPLLEQRSLPPEAQWIESQIQRDWQTALAINDYYLGAGSGSAGTASEAAMLNASAATRFRLQALIGEERFVTELARKFFARRQQYLQEEQVFRIAGQKGFDYPKIGPDDLGGAYDFLPLGTQSQANKEVLRQQLLQALAVIANNQYFAEHSDHYELLKHFWQSFDVRFPDRFIVPPDDKTIPPEQENIILAAGEFVPVSPFMDHEAHMAAHQQILPAVAGNFRAEEAVIKHIKEHQKYLEQGGGATPPQEQSGQPRGAAGNVPGDPNASIPSMDRIQSTTMGGPGGPIA